MSATFDSWDIETETVITFADGARKKCPCDPRPVKRFGKSGRFGTLRQAQEWIRGRILFRGSYRTREEIAVWLQQSKEWKGAHVERTEHGWHFRLGTAELLLRAA